MESNHNYIHTWHTKAKKFNGNNSKLYYHKSQHSTSQWRSKKEIISEKREKLAKKLIRLFFELSDNFAIRGSYVCRKDWATQHDADLDITYRLVGVFCQNDFDKSIERFKNLLHIMEIEYRELKKESPQNKYPGNLILKKLKITEDRCSLNLDICFSPAIQLDFDTNGLELTKRGITIWKDDLDYIKLQDLIDANEFNIYFDANDRRSVSELGHIITRVRKRELRGDRCLNFSEVKNHLPAQYHPLIDAEQMSKCKTNEDCIICLDAIQEGDIVMKITSCIHSESFHHRCLVSWALCSSERGMAENPTCPICRQGIRT